MQPYHYNLAARFKEIVDTYPNNVALYYPEKGEEVTYAELDRLSNEMLGCLKEIGVARKDVVAILNDKSPKAFATMLGCLKNGSVYTNLDVTSPRERLQKILDRCKPKVLFIDEGIADPLEGSDLERHLLGDVSSTAQDYGWDHTVTGSFPAYIMFTSGSTGFPKGAVMSHENVLNLIDWSRTTFDLTPADKMTNVNPVYFDNSVFDFYSAIFNGATLVPFKADETKNPKVLVELVNKAQCTTWFSVPSMLVFILTTKAVTGDDFQHMRQIVFGGEGFPKPKLKKLYDLLGDRVQLVNVYGPTECTCICSSYLISEQDFEDMTSLAPLGDIAPNFEYEILYGEPGDTIGELMLKGPQVGMGYYNDPERTAQAFIQSPTNSYFQEVGYRTGDLVELDSKGHLHFKGRADNQIKHMGYRIELEEIEAALNTLEYVDECAVIYQELTQGMGNILAFVALSSDVPDTQIKERVEALLPPYMCPKKVRVLDQLPKNRNGKIDRKALKEL